LLDVLVSPIHFELAELAVGTRNFCIRVARVRSGYEWIDLIAVALLAYMAVFHKQLRFPNMLVPLRRSPSAIPKSWCLGHWTLR
jgi:hypothetical protein